MVTFLSHFTPSMMPEDVIERIFVQRKRLASRLVTLIRESVLGTAKHHTLIVGPRGIGKTHLASLVYHRVRGMPDVADKMRIAWLREEEWGIASFLDFVIRILRALDEGYPDAELAGRIEGLFAHNPEQAEREAVAILDEFVGERTVFLITENLDQLFEGLDDVGQQQFRAYLQDRATWTILATAPGLFNGISLQSSPFYGFFRIQHLKELSIDEAVELLQKIAEIGGRDELASFVQTPVGRARIRAVHHLAGGNHRIYVIFSEFLTRETLDDLVEPFLTTMDHLTPYYQARMQSLSPQMRKIIDYLCDVRHAVSVKEIAQRCFISQQTASAQLKLLKERGFVRSFTVGRESHYELLEPLLRLSLEVKKQRGEPIRLFIDFLRFWYTRPELEARLLTAQMVSPTDREYLLRTLQQWDQLSLTSEIHVQEWAEKLVESFQHGDIAGALEFADTLVHMRGDPADYILKAGCLFGLGDSEAGLSCLEEAHGFAPSHQGVILALGYGYTKLGRFSEALEIVDGSATPDELPSLGWAIRAEILTSLGRVPEALAAYETALRLDPQNSDLRVDFALCLQRQARFDEALKLVAAVPDSGTNAWVLEVTGALLVMVGRPEDGVDALRTANQIQETSNRRARLAAALFAVGRADDAQVESARALDLDAGNPLAWAQFCLLQVSRGETEAALASILRASELNPTSPEIQVLTGVCFENVGKTREAVSFYRRAIQGRIDDRTPYLRLPLALAKSGEWEEALASLRQAIRQEDGRPVGDAGLADALLGVWLVSRPSSTWLRELKVIAEVYTEAGIVTILSIAIAKSLASIVSANMDPARARTWADTWESLAQISAELGFGVRLLRAGTEYHITGDPRHLLELVTEERAMVESIPGIRPLSEPTGR